MGKCTYLLSACYNMSKDEKISFYQCLKGVKVSQGHSSNVKNLISMQDFKLIRLKSNDCAIGKGVGIWQYFIFAPRNSSSSPVADTKAEMASKIRQKLIEEMKKEIERVQLEFVEKNLLLWQEFLSHQHCVESLVAPTLRTQRGVVQLVQRHGRMSWTTSNQWATCSKSNSTSVESVPTSKFVTSWF